MQKEEDVELSWQERNYLKYGPRQRRDTRLRQIHRARAMHLTPEGVQYLEIGGLKDEPRRLKNIYAAREIHSLFLARPIVVEDDAEEQEGN